MAMAARNKPVTLSSKSGPKKYLDSVLVINNENIRITEYSKLWQSHHPVEDLIGAQLKIYHFVHCQLSPQLFRA